MTRRLAFLGLAAAACAAALSLPASGANFASSSIEHRERRHGRDRELPAAASPTRPTPTHADRLRDKRNSSPLGAARRRAPTTRSRVALGGYKNTNNTRDPARASPSRRATRCRPASPSITVTATLLPDASGKQPLTGYTFTNLLGLGPTSSVTLGPGDKRWVNLSASMKGSAFPGNNLLYHADRAHHGPPRGLHRHASSPTTSP